MDNSFDILRIRSGVTNKLYKSSINDDLSRGELLRLACNEASDGDVLELSPATFDVDGRNKGALVFPNNVTIRGAGMERTTLLSNIYSDYAANPDPSQNYIYDGKAGQAFKLTNSVIEDLTIKRVKFEDNTLSYEEDGQAIGFYCGKPLNPAHPEKPNDNDGYLFCKDRDTYQAIIRRCHIKSNAWAFYSWNNKGDKCDIIDSKITSGHQGVSIMGSGSYSYKNEANIYRCFFDINPNKYSIYGAVSDSKFGGAYGVISRGGKVKVIDCDFKLVGYIRPRVTDKRSPRCIGISDTFNTVGSKHTKIESFNNRFYITPNDATVCYSLYNELEKSIYSQNDYANGELSKKEVLGLILNTDND